MKLIFDNIFKLYYRPLCLYALHYVHDIDNAEDIVQDCFVAMIEKGMGENIDNVRSYLYIAVRNRCLNMLRDTHKELSATDAEGDISDEEAVEASLHEAELWTAIDSLPAKCREVFLMSKQQGLKYREIANELGISEKTVEHQISKALKVLRGKVSDFFYSLLCLS